MNPFEQAWRWWTTLVDVPLWDPWLATLAVFALAVLVFALLHGLLRP